MQLTYTLFSPLSSKKIPPKPENPEHRGDAPGQLVKKQDGCGPMGHRALRSVQGRPVSGPYGGGTRLDGRFPCRQVSGGLATNGSAARGNPPLRSRGTTYGFAAPGPVAARPKALGKKDPTNRHEPSHRRNRSVKQTCRWHVCSVGRPAMPDGCRVDQASCADSNHPQWQPGKKRVS